MKTKVTAFTLIELIVSIVVLGITTGLFMSLSTLSRYSYIPANQLLAFNLAQTRLEVVWRFLEDQCPSSGGSGITNAVDPCTTSPSYPSYVCAVPAGYSVNTTINCSGSSPYSSCNVTVTTRGKGNISLPVVPMGCA